jgi:hypothetical protein
VASSVSGRILIVVCPFHSDFTLKDFASALYPRLNDFALGKTAYRRPLPEMELFGVGLRQ